MRRIRSLNCLDLLAKFGIEKGIFTVNAAANACLDNSWPRALQLLHEAAVEDGLQLNTVSYNILLGAGERGGILGVRDSLLSRMLDAQLSPSLVTYNTLIKLCGADEDWTAALQYLEELWQSTYELQPDIVSYNSAISVCQKCSQWQLALMLLGDAEQQGLRLDAFTFGAAVDGAAKSRRWRSAISLLRALWPASSRGIRPNVVVCSSACDALAQVHWEKALGLLSDMICAALLPNAFTICASIGGCGRGQQWANPLDLLYWFGRGHASGCTPLLPETLSATTGACAQAESVTMQTSPCCSL